MPTRIERLASNSTMYYRGDCCLEISPFDNYYMFTIYRESNDTATDDSVPLNLTNLGTIYLSFINSGDNKVRIANYTDAENVDMANGEVVFKITASDSGKILSFANKNFYISAVMEDASSKGDETVIYSGTWTDFASDMQSSLSETIYDLRDTVANMQNQIIADTETANARIRELESQVDVLTSERDMLNARIQDLEQQLLNIGSNYVTANIVSSETQQNERRLPSSASKTAAQTSMSLEASVKELQASSLVSVFDGNKNTEGSNTKSTNSRANR